MKLKYLRFFNSYKSFLDQLIFYSFLLVIITYPFTINLNSITLILLFTLSLIKLYFTKSVKTSPLITLFYLFFISRLVSLCYTQNMDDGIRIIERSLSLIVLPFIFMVNQNLLFQKVKIIKVLSISSFIACLYCLFRNFYFFISNNIPSKWWLDWKYNNYHLSKYLDFGPNYFSTLIMINLICTYFFKKKLNRLYWILIIVQLFFLLLLSSRGIILFFAAFSFILFIKAAYVRYNFLGVISSVIIIIGLTYTTLESIPVLNSRFKKSLTELKSENSTKGHVGGLYNRFKKIEASTTIIQKNPLLGVGIGDVRIALREQYVLMDFKEGIKRSFDAHNQYLQSLLASGIFGFVSFTSILLYGLYRAIISRDMLYFSLISLFMFFALLESFMETHKGIVLASIVILLFFPFNDDKAAKYSIKSPIRYYK